MKKLGSDDGTVLDCSVGALDGARNRALVVSTLGVPLECTNGEMLGSDEGIIIGSTAPGC